MFQERQFFCPPSILHSVFCWSKTITWSPSTKLHQLMISNNYHATRIILAFSSYHAALTHIHWLFFFPKKYSTRIFLSVAKWLRDKNIIAHLSRTRPLVRFCCRWLTQGRSCWFGSGHGWSVRPPLSWCLPGSRWRGHIVSWYTQPQAAAPSPACSPPPL